MKRAQNFGQPARSTFWVLCLLVVGAITSAGEVSGQRPLLVILLEFQDRTFAAERSAEHYRARIFGPGEPNVTAYFNETSHGHFTYVAATGGDLDGGADGMVRVVMNVRQEQSPTGSEFRDQALALANPSFNYSLYDANGDGRIQDRELTVLVIQATGEQSGKVVTAGDVVFDRVSLRGIPVPVIADNAPNYVLYHELAHAVDSNGYTGRDLYNLRDGLRQKATLWSVGANGALTRAGSVTSEIALDLDAHPFSAGAAVAAYRDQNGELRLANFDFSKPDTPLLKKMASAGLVSEVSVAQVSPLRLVTAVRSGDGNLKVIVWDVNFAWEFTRRGDYTAGAASDIEVATVSSSRVVVACRTAGGDLKLIAFDISQTGELTRRGSHSVEEASEINLVTLNSSRVVAAIRQASGDLKVICFDLSQGGEFTQRGDWEAGGATDIDLTRISNQRVATSVRTAGGRLKIILFDVAAEGDVTRRGSYEGGALCDRNIQCNDRSSPLPSDLTSKTSLTRLSASRLAVSYIDPDKLLQIRTLDLEDDGASLSLVGSQSSQGKYVAARVVKVSGSVLATLGQLDGQIWTGNSFGLLGGHTGDDVVHFDPYTKLKLGWLPYTEIAASTPLGLAPMGHSAAQAVIIRVPGHRETEYFILEVRTKYSLYEAGLGDVGLAIWHVDEEKEYPHPFVSLEWLGGSPGTALWNYNEPELALYDDSSAPAGARWSDFSASGVSISRVASFFGVLTFNIDIRR